MRLKQDFIFTPNGKNRPLHIWLPDDYGSTEERYPVMYFFDGHNMFSDADATYGRSWHLADFLQQWDKQMIVVGIECGHEGNERLVEYTPYSMDSSFLGKYDGNGHETLRFIAEELKPVIDREFRTWPHREATGICGSSMGGLMSIYAAVKFNGTFGKAACLSSAIGDVMHLLREDILSAPMDSDTRVYLSIGGKEAGGVNSHWVQNNREIQRLLEQRGARTLLEVIPRGAHNEAAWEKRIPTFMRFLWQEE